MKTKKIFVFVVVALCAIIGLRKVYSASEIDPIAKLALENVEAIAMNEIEGEGRITCYSSFVGKENGRRYTVKDCGTCMDVDCEGYSDQGKCKL